MIGSVAARTSRISSCQLVFATFAVTEPSIRKGSLDVVVSFEVVERLPTLEAHKLFFRGVLRVVKSDGIFIGSTLSRKMTVPHEETVGVFVGDHLTEIDATPLRGELKREFTVDLFGGMRYQGNGAYRLLRAVDTHNLRLPVPPILGEFLARTLFSG
jgi:hypothetical protein